MHSVLEGGERDRGRERGGEVEGGGGGGERELPQTGLEGGER